MRDEPTGGRFIKRSFGWREQVVRPALIGEPSKARRELLTLEAAPEASGKFTPSHPSPARPGVRVRDAERSEVDTVQPLLSLLRGTPGRCNVVRIGCHGRDGLQVDRLVHGVKDPGRVRVPLGVVPGG